MVQSFPSLLLISILCLLSRTPLVATGDAEPAQLEASLLNEHDDHAGAPERVVISGLTDATAIAVTAACEGPVEGCSLRHKEEKERLLARIDPNRGAWNENHPRWRLLKAIDGFRSYRDANKAEVDRWRDAYRHVGKGQKKLLESAVNYKQKLNDLDHLHDRNALLCDAIAQHALAYYGIPEPELARFVRDEEKAGRKPERVSVVQALKHYVRDWAAEGGARERGPTFPCLLRTLAGLYPERGGNNASAPRPRVLVPGAGLGRLGFEVAEMGGFEVTTNEWSTYMIAAYRYLEAHPTPESHTFHPFLDSLSHHASTADLKRQVTFPEPDTALNDPSNVLLVEGDFTTVFSNDGEKYDVIITYFFLDTARNLLNYLETIHRLLRPGGHWLNLGPLLYGTGPWVQLSLDEIVRVAEALGFEFRDDLDPAVCGERTFPPGDDEEAGAKGKGGGLRTVRGKEAVYGSNARGLTTSSYMAQSWVARKPE
ncbi:carnosine N-methyltransferase [Apiospora aurea]|uniref:Carnosine N-methyltransferase n=1 Tax=Apiospora aurea TaxID=335848 RepID=A0ABR1PXI8_9PEZI